MASINTYPDAEDASDSSGSRRGRRSTGRKQRLKNRRQRARAAMHRGWPKWSGLQPIVMFLIFPACFALLIIVTGGSWPQYVLYPVAALLGIYVLISAFSGVELTLACLLLYLPFSTTYVIPIAPGVNGTNMLMLIGLFASVMSASSNRRSMLHWPSGTGFVVAFAVLSTFSGITILSQPGGFSYLVHNELHSFKGWIDQFLLYFIALSAIRDRETAKRVVLYMCLGAVVLVIYAVPEMLDKMGRSTIEKSRIIGPHRQSNNFGGFVAYTLMPIGALFLTYIKDYRVWAIVPYFLIAAKVLISTFSRGAYLAIAVGAMMATYFKGKGFLIMVGTLALALVLAFPSIIPESILIRMQSITESTPSTSTPDKLDKSSESRLILWRAAVNMTLEDPVFGKGFKGFQKLKSQYTEEPVKESDPHSMYLYVASQMGLPAMLLFLVILAYSFHLGRVLSRNREDLFVRAIGIGGAAATVCYATICVFGSRAVNLEFTAYFWTYLACMQLLRQQQKAEISAAKPKKKRSTAMDSKQLAHEPSPEPPPEALPVGGTKLLTSPQMQRLKKRTNRTNSGVKGRKRG